MLIVASPVSLALFRASAITVGFIACKIRVLRCRHRLVTNASFCVVLSIVAKSHHLLCVFVITFHTVEDTWLGNVVDGSSERMLS